MPHIEGHFALGLTVAVRKGALPAGFETGSHAEDDPAEYAPDGPRQITAVSDDGTVEVATWWWYPTDLVVVP